MARTRKRKPFEDKWDDIGDIVVRNAAGEVVFDGAQEEKEETKKLEELKRKQSKPNTAT